jgi:hypothetical protein
MGVWAEGTQFVCPIQKKETLKKCPHLSSRFVFVCVMRVYFVAPGIQVKRKDDSWETVPKVLDFIDDTGICQTQKTLWTTLALPLLLLSRESMNELMDIQQEESNRRRVKRL